MISRTFSTGAAKTACSIRKSMQRAMASVSGRRMTNALPFPGVDSTSIDPFRDSIFVRTISMPTPRPEIFETAAAVLKPGFQMKAINSLGLNAAA